MKTSVQFFQRLLFISPNIENMPHATDEENTPCGEGPRRLVLCFDGTSNQFQGNEADTNIVKIYQMLERHTPGQFHYYQRT